MHDGPRTSGTAFVFKKEVRNALPIRDTAVDLFLDYFILGDSVEALSMM
jgi:hypothetical protein